MAIGALIIGAVFVNNLILVQFLGICPFLGVSKKVESAFGMGMAVIFVMTVSSLISFALYQYVLVALGLEYLKTIVFIFVIAGLVQILEWRLKIRSRAVQVDGRLSAAYYNQLRNPRRCRA